MGGKTFLITASWIEPAGILVRKIDAGVEECGLQDHHYGKNYAGREHYFREVPKLRELHDLHLKAKRKFD